MTLPFRIIPFSVSQTLTEEDLAEQILVKVNVDASCDLIYSEEISVGLNPISFAEHVNLLANY
jgi:hypothetical protein